MKGRAPLLCAALVLLAGSAAATPNTTFGAGPRDEALQRSAVAEGDLTDAATLNPAFAAAEGVRARLGYGASLLLLRVNDRDTGAAPVTGLDIGAQAGLRLTSDLFGGVGLAIHRPDKQLASISFRPATEPQFVLYEAALQRLTFDVVGALRYGPVSLGGGASVALGVGGPGVQIDVTQDARGPHAGGSADISLGYKLAPLVGLTARFGRLQVGATFRGDLAVDLALDSAVKVGLQGNPLNGDTAVILRGASGYDPARIDLGARVLVARGLRAYAAVEIATYSAAPPPIADVKIDVHLGTTPSLPAGRFEEPRFHDTVSPRIGLEWRSPSPPLSGSFFGGEPRGPDPWKASLRAGYVYAPSPVPPQRGFTSYADSARHGVGLGAAYHFGDVLGIDVTASLAVQIHVLEDRIEKKASPVLPFAEYRVGGEMARASLALEGAFK